jgi:hypothetical protein
MMREIEGVTGEGQSRRRWFHDDYFDLFVWQNPDGEVTLFQLCYGPGSSGRALVWDKARGFFHDGARSGEGEVIGAGATSGDPILVRFTSAAAVLPAEVKSPVLNKMREFVEKKPGVPARRERFRRADWQRRDVDGPAGKAR